MNQVDEFGGFSSLENPFSPDLNSHGLTDHDLTILLAANDRLQHSRAETKEQAELIETLVRLPAIGLKLQISPSLLKQMERSALPKRKRTSHARDTSSRARSSKVQARVDYDSEKLKASNLGALKLHIGSWQLVARNEGDLVAKCYYAKKKLVWEILRNGLKEKIEMEWSDIIGIRASTEENKPGLLAVELQKPPKFYKEIDPEPRKHTQWTDGSDFTEGQAYVYRMHFIVFPPGVLDKHYQKLIKYDNRLFELSQKPFPTFNFPYFPSPLHNQLPAIQFEENRFQVPSSLQFVGHQTVPQRQTQCYNNHTVQLARGIDSLTSPRSVVDFTSHFNEMVSSQGQRMELLNQVNMMRTYQLANHSQENPVICPGEVPLRGTMTSNNQILNNYAYYTGANPIPYPLSRQAENYLNIASSAQTEHCSAAPINMVTPQVLNGQMLNCPRDKNALYGWAASGTKEDSFA